MFREILITHVSLIVLLPELPLLIAALVVALEDLRDPSGGLPFCICGSVGQFLLPGRLQVQEDLAALVDGRSGVGQGDSLETVFCEDLVVPIWCHRTVRR